MSVCYIDMNIRGWSGVARPGFLLIQLELPILKFREVHLISTLSFPPLACNHHHHQENAGFTLESQHTVAERSVSTSKPYYSQRMKKKEGASSLYVRPSLLDLKKQKLVNRARVYEFLRGIGVVPDELDGLELPVTVDVMKERVDFLHKLGLTIEDINSYPLVLGCSVKKNMIPVLDYLGKLGVRKSSFTEFLRRYPQVLHASVAVDLQPVVKYLQGMDVKQADIPRVLESYPEVLGFKLEGTMSTSVAYLVGIGVGRREIGGLLTRYPQILGMRVGSVIKPLVEYLESLGIPRLAVARLIEQRPHILGFELEERVKPNVGYLLDFNVRERLLAAVIAQYPEIIGIDLKSKLCSQQRSFNSILDLGSEDFGQIVERMPQAVSLSKTAIVKHVDFLKICGFSSQQIKKMVVGYPQLLALNLDIMKLNFDYFRLEMARPLDDLVDFPAFFTYGLESTIKPRHQQVAKKGLKCSLSWLLNCSDEKFKRRMSYESIDFEEMEPEPTFDMKSLMESRIDESDCEIDYYDDEDI
ncbi:Transcription termination factor MTERF4 chloroplastic [Bienertia sinuspersici]